MPVTLKKYGIPENILLHILGMCDFRLVCVPHTTHIQINVMILIYDS